MAVANKNNRKIKVKVYDLINKTKLFTLSTSHPDHSHAVFTLVTLLHEAGYEVNWHTQHLRSFSFRNDKLPLYLRQAEMKNRVYADIVFALDDKTLAALEITTWRKQTLAESIKKQFEEALMKAKAGGGENGKS